MHKSGVKILFLFGLIIGVCAISFSMLSIYENTAFEPRVSEITITDVEFKGMSGSENNGVLVYVENDNKVTDVVVKDVRVSAEGFDRTFPVLPEENNYPTASHGQITLTNVGWEKSIDYKFWIFTHDGMICGAFHKIA